MKSFLLLIAESTKLLVQQKFYSVFMTYWLTLVNASHYKSKTLEDMFERDAAASSISARRRKIQNRSSALALNVRCLLQLCSKEEKLKKNWRKSLQSVRKSEKQGKDFVTNEIYANAFGKNCFNRQLIHLERTFPFSGCHKTLR